MEITANGLWAIAPEALEELCAIFPARLAAMSDDQIEARQRQQTEERRNVVGRIGVVGVYGPVFHRPSLFSAVWGGAITTRIAAEIRTLAADPDVDAILMDISSPGGSVYGLEELARELRAAREEKPVVAVADAYAFSAAYYIASQASSLAVIPSGEVGSVGVILVHLDWSKALAEDGIKVTIIKAGKYKAEFNPYEPLSDDAKAYEQRRVDEYYAMFVNAVAAGRRVDPETVEKEFGQGRIVGASDALARRMVDRIATLEEEAGRLAGEIAQTKSLAAKAGADAAGKVAAALECERRRLELLEA